MGGEYLQHHLKNFVIATVLNGYPHGCPIIGFQT